MLNIKNIYHCIYKGIEDTINHDGVEHAGYIAFLMILSLFPFLVFFFAIVGFFGQTEIGLKFISIILENNLIPSNILQALSPRIEEISSGPPQGLLTIAIVGAVWTASSAVDALRFILNRAYRVSTPPAYIWRRLMSIVEFFILTVALALVTLFLVIAPNMWEHISQFLHLENLSKTLEQSAFYMSSTWDYIRYAATALVTFLVVSIAYIILPNTKQSLANVAPGAAAVVFAWFVAGSALSYYLSKFEQVSIIYGSLGGLIAALLFFYINAMIFVFGAEFNYALEKSKGHKIEEREKA